MGANEDFKRLAKEMAEKARAQREKAAREAQEGKDSGDGEARENTGDRPASESGRRQDRG